METSILKQYHLCVFIALKRDVLRIYPLVLAQQLRFSFKE